MTLDILAFGAHPDDVEMSCGGTLYKHIKKGNKVGIIDLTQGEMGTRGTVETRQKESKKAAEILGISIRENLNFKDCFFENSEPNRLEVIKVIRKYRPKIIIVNAPSDRHPDHGRANKLLNEAFFYSGLTKLETPGLEPFRPKIILSYIQDRHLSPSFIVDISKEYEIKKQSIEAYSSQFYNPNSVNETKTKISTEGFWLSLEARCRVWGSRIGVEFGEGFIIHDIVGIEDLDCIALPEIA